MQKPPSAYALFFFITPALSGGRCAKKKKRGWGDTKIEIEKEKKIKTKINESK